MHHRYTVINDHMPLSLGGPVREKPQAAPLDPALDQARMLAAQAWCQDSTKHKVMDPVLCEAFARILDGWMKDCCREMVNAAFYRGLLDECAEHLGEAAFTSDDGTRHEAPARLKIPHLVAAQAGTIKMLADLLWRENLQNPKELPTVVYDVMTGDYMVKTNLATVASGG